VSRTASIIIVASSALLREGMVSILQSTPYKVVATVGGPGELADHELTGSALAIVGIDWQNGSHDRAAESIRLLRSLMPDSKIVLVAETHGTVDLQSLLALALDGYILNLGSREMLVKSLELIFMDQQIFVLGRPIPAPPNGRNDAQFPKPAVGSQSGGSYGLGEKIHGIQLSHRERQVLICLAHGQSNKGIARVCDISEATVKVHLKAILRKTNARNRTQAAIWAIEHGLRDSTLKANAEMPKHLAKTATDAPSLSPAEPADERLANIPINDQTRS
jgi:two-component system, NarL family, nitrate/nitrite response regulator NarL